VRGELEELWKTIIDEVYLMQLAEELVLIVQGEITSIILIAPRSDHCVTLSHPLSKVPSLFPCSLQSVHKMIIENFQIGDSRSSKIFRGRTEWLDSERHDEPKATNGMIAPSGPSSE
jgi:hypothetical protein